VKTPYSQGVFRITIYLREIGKKFYLLEKFPSATLALFKNDRNLSKANQLCGYVNNQKVIHNSAQLSHDLKR